LEALRIARPRPHSPARRADVAAMRCGQPRGLGSAPAAADPSLLTRRAPAARAAGCDALAVHLVVTTLGASISGGFSWQTVAGHMAIMGPWLAAHWEEYHTGVMLYGNGYWGVTEANYVMVAVHLFTAAAGPGARALCRGQRAAVDTLSPGYCPLRVVQPALVWESRGRSSCLQSPSTVASAVGPPALAMKGGHALIFDR